MALQINILTVTAMVPVQPTIIQPATRINYPVYNPGYNPGTLIVYQLPAMANPPPTPNQYLITSTHTYQAFSITDLPAVLFRLEAFEDRFVDSRTNEDISVPMLYNSITRTPIAALHSDTSPFYLDTSHRTYQDVYGNSGSGLITDWK